MFAYSAYVLHLNVVELHFDCWQKAVQSAILIDALPAEDSGYPRTMHGISGIDIKPGINEIISRLSKYNIAF